VRAQVGERVQLDADLLAHFAAQRRFGRLAGVDEAAGERQPAEPRLVAAADEQRAPVVPQQDAGGGNGRVEVIGEAAGRTDQRTRAGRGQRRAAAGTAAELGSRLGGIEDRLGHARMVPHPPGQGRPRAGAPAAIYWRFTRVRR